MAFLNASGHRYGQWEHVFPIILLFQIICFYFIIMISSNSLIFFLNNVSNASIMNEKKINVKGVIYFCGVTQL